MAGATRTRVGEVALPLQAMLLVLLMNAKQEGRLTVTEKAPTIPDMTGEGTGRLPVPAITINVASCSRRVAVLSSGGSVVLSRSS